MGDDLETSRQKSRENDSLEFEQARHKFLEWLSVNNWNPPISVFEMYPSLNGDAIKTTPEIYNYFNKWHNTRTKSPAETCWETDKLPLNKAVAVTCEILLSLIRNKFHFIVFYSEGARSPHIRIYDFEELRELTPYQRLKAQIAFWRKHVPFGCFQYTDTGIFDDDHYLCLEFAPHWKHGTIFNILFEYVPQQEEQKCKVWV